MATIFLALLIFGGYVLYYVREIKQGKGEFLFNKVYGGFSQSANQKETAAKIDRKKLELSTAPFLGANEAKTIIVEFVDYKCPNSKAASEIMKKVLQKFGNEVKIIVRNFPAESTRPGANKLAIFGFCAKEQGLFWLAHDIMFDVQEDLGADIGDEELKVLSDEIGAEWAKMKICLNSSKAKIAINRDYADGYSFGVQGTPTVFINGEKTEGVVPFNVWEGYLSNIK
jgi:protein-disulfide isomerase